MTLLCSVCGQDCHCGRFFTDHRCSMPEAPARPVASSSSEARCHLCGVPAKAANVYLDTLECVSRVRCAERVKALSEG